MYNHTFTFIYTKRAFLLLKFDVDHILKFKGSKGIVCLIGEMDLSEPEINTEELVSEIEECMVNYIYIRLI
jgi:hypothetical protein